MSGREVAEAEIARLRAVMLECARGLEGDIPPGRKEAVLMRLRSEAAASEKETSCNAIE